MKPHPILLPISWIYGGVIRLRNILFDVGFFQSSAASVPVISVGNITAGGTGKTPFVDMLVKFLVHNSIRPAVVSRGYGRSTKGLVEVSNMKGILISAEEAGDEPFMLAKKNPGLVVIVDEKRKRGVDHAIRQYGTEAVILDDGFQHRSVRRNLDVVLIDGEESKSPMHLLPAGYLREPIGGLRRADIVIISKTGTADGIPDIIRRATNAEIMTTSFIPVAVRRVKTGFSISVQSIRGKKAVAFCGISNPQNFNATLIRMGMTVERFFPFDDHHRYSETEIKSISEAAKSVSSDYVLTTEKDLARLEGGLLLKMFDELPLFVVEMEMTVREEEAWFKKVLSVVRRETNR
jgi:tetraacyldisaccharide 4'-kinase